MHQLIPAYTSPNTGLRSLPHLLSAKTFQLSNNTLVICISQMVTEANRTKWQRECHRLVGKRELMLILLVERSTELFSHRKKSQTPLVAAWKMLREAL